jgi:hypothetical protein
MRVLEETKWIPGGPHGATARLGIKRTTLQSLLEQLGQPSRAHPATRRAAREPGDADGSDVHAAM